MFSPVRVLVFHFNLHWLYIQQQVGGVTKISSEDTMLTVSNAAGESTSVPVPKDTLVTIHVPALHFNRAKLQCNPYLSCDVLPFSTVLGGSVRFQARPIPQRLASWGVYTFQRRCISESFYKLYCSNWQCPPGARACLGRKCDIWSLARLCWLINMSEGSSRLKESPFSQCLSCAIRSSWKKNLSSQTKLSMIRRQGFWQHSLVSRWRESIDIRPLTFRNHFDPIIISPVRVPLVFKKRRQSWCRLWVFHVGKEVAGQSRFIPIVTSCSVV